MGDENATVNAALYYPFINFRDESWVKRAVLHWDKISRIAPPGYESIDPPQYWATQPADLRQLEDLEIVERVDTYSVQPEVETLWIAFLKKHGDALTKRFRLDLEKREIVPDDGTNRSGYGVNPSRRRAGVGWLYTPKMSTRLRREFERLRLSVDGEKHGAINWSAFDEQLLDAYMTTLANALIGGKDIDTVADNSSHFRRFQANSVDELSALLLPKAATRAKKPNVADGENGPNMVALAIEAVQPGGVEVMSLNDVLAVRETSKDARREFKKAIDAMVKELRTMRAKDLKDRVTEKQLEELHIRHIKKPLAELRKSMRWNTVDAATSVLTLKSSLESGTLAAMLASAATGSGILTVAGLGLAALTAWRNARQRKKELKKQPLAWLLDVEKILDSRGVLAKLR